MVTGGAGFIGSHTVVALIEQGFQPIIADDFRNSEERALTGIESITGVSPTTHKIDVTDKEALKTLFENYNFSGVIHFAAYKSVNESVNNPLKYYRNNLVSLINCIELCEAYGVPNFVFSSSCTVYGIPDDVVVKESTPMKPAHSPYGQTKQICEEILQNVHTSGSDLKILCLRYFNPIGAHSSGEIGELPLGVPSNLVPYVTQTAIGKLEQLTVFGDDYDTQDGTCIRDFIHVVDLADAHLKGLRWLDQHDKPTNTIVNVGTGNGASVLEIIHTFEKVSNTRLSWKFGARREGDVPQIYAEVSLAESLLNWTARHNLEDCLRDAWNWEQKLADEK